MKTILTIDQMEEELAYVRIRNQKLLKELQDVKNENDQLRKNFQQDREWLAEKLEIIAQSQIQGFPEFSGLCHCGLAAVLEQAKRRASMRLEVFGDSHSDPETLRRTTNYL
jgi:hypothetical protein